MIKRKKNLTPTPRPNMLGGKGTAQVSSLFEKGEYRGHARLMAVLELEPGCSVGDHRHQEEEEFVYILSGRAVYYDNGVREELLPGDAALTVSGEGHEIVNEGTETLRYLAMVLTYDREQMGKTACGGESL